MSDIQKCKRETKAHYKSLVAALRAINEEATHHLGEMQCIRGMARDALRRHAEFTKESTE